MEINVLCSECGEKLEIQETYGGIDDTIDIYVIPCDCRELEDE